MLKKGRVFLSFIVTWKQHFWAFVSVIKVNTQWNFLQKKVSIAKHKTIVLFPFFLCDSKNIFSFLLWQTLGQDRPILAPDTSDRSDTSEDLEVWVLMLRSQNYYIVWAWEAGVQSGCQGQGQVSVSQSQPAHQPKLGQVSRHGAGWYFECTDQSLKVLTPQWG